MFSVLSKKVSSSLRTSPRFFSSFKSKRGPVTFASLLLTGLAAGGMLVYYNIEKDEQMKQVSKNVETVGKPALGGPWVLVDHNVSCCVSILFHLRVLILEIGCPKNRCFVPWSILFVLLWIHPLS